MAGVAFVRGLPTTRTTACLARRVDTRTTVLTITSTARGPPCRPWVGEMSNGTRRGQA
jgi:hypothetical protein